MMNCAAILAIILMYVSSDLINIELEDESYIKIVIISQHKECCRGAVRLLNLNIVFIVIKLRMDNLTVTLHHTHSNVMNESKNKREIDQIPLNQCSMKTNLYARTVSH